MASTLSISASPPAPCDSHSTLPHPPPCSCDECIPDELELRLDLVLAHAQVSDAITLSDHIAAERDEALDALDAAEREVKALRWCNGARDRHITRLLRQVTDLTKRLPRTEQHTVTPAEAFTALHPIEDVIGQVVKLEPREDGYRRYKVGRCPFHKDEHPSPSLVVRPWYGQFACYACAAHGDVIDFLRLCKEHGHGDGGVE